MEFYQKIWHKECSFFLFVLLLLGIVSTYFPFNVTQIGNLFRFFFSFYFDCRTVFLSFIHRSKRSLKKKSLRYRYDDNTSPCGKAAHKLLHLFFYFFSFSATHPQNGREIEKFMEENSENNKC